MLQVKKNLIYFRNNLLSVFLTHIAFSVKSLQKQIVIDTFVHAQNRQPHQIVHPLSQPDPLLLYTIIFLSEPSSSQSPCSSHSHFPPTELIRGGGHSSMLAEYTL